MNICMTRESLLARLKNRLEAAIRDDEKAMAAHEREERLALKKFHDKCRDALLWDYKKLKARNFEIELSYSQRPDCPSAEAPEIRKAITEVTLDKRKDFTVTPKTNIYDAVNWLPRAEQNTKMC